MMMRMTVIAYLCAVVQVSWLNSLFSCSVWFFCCLVDGVQKHVTVRQLSTTHLSTCGLIGRPTHQSLSPVNAVPRSTQPSTLRGTVTEYQPYGWVIIPVAMGECSAYGSLQADSKVKFAAWPASWRPPGADRPWPRWTAVNSRVWLAP